MKLSTFSTRTARLESRKRLPYQVLLLSDKLVWPVTLDSMVTLSKPSGYLKIFRLFYVSISKIHDIPATGFPVLSVSAVQSLFFCRFTCQPSAKYLFLFSTKCLIYLYVFTAFAVSKGYRHVKCLDDLVIPWYRNIIEGFFHLERHRETKYHVFFFTVKSISPIIILTLNQNTFLFKTFSRFGLWLVLIFLAFLLSGPGSV